MQTSISLAVICKADKREAELLDACLFSVSSFVDEICVTITGESEEVEAVCKNYNAKVSHFDWIDDFSAARAYNFSQCTGDWILWLDADDTLQGADKLKNTVELAEERGVSGLGMIYKYGFDENGNCVDEHWKVQLVKNDGHCEWRGAIHEDLAMLRAVTWSKTNDLVRVHHAAHEQTQEKYERNLRILRKELGRNNEEPRTWFYLGRTHIAAGQLEEGIRALIRYLELSGWDEERYEANLLIGQCYMQAKQYDEALQWYNTALLEKENYPDAYIYKAMAYMKLEKWKQAVTNFELALTLPKPPANTFFNPMLYAREMPLALALSYVQVGKFAEAVKYAQYAYKTDPKNKQAISTLQLCQEIYGKVELSKKYVEIAEQLDDTNAKTLLASVPASIVDNPFILKLRRKYFPPVKWPTKSLAVYCATTAEAWDAESAKTKGIGGSETAVIEITERMAKEGWKITVYNYCNAPAEGKTINGVTYKNYWEFNYQDEFDALWVWRTPEMFDYELKARIKVLDLHDVMNPLEFTPERVARMDKIFVKTKYHRSLLPNIPDDKFEIIGNGIDLSRFGKQVNKIPHKFIYSSTPNRGLDILLEYMWDDIKKEIPDAELHVFYGWNTFYALEKNNPERMAWMKKVQKLMEKPGVINHGRVDQQALAGHQLEASFWLYPTYFPEIHCITACEMQAAGAIPITSGYAALAETVKNGFTVEGDVYDPEYHKRFTTALVEAYRGNQDKLRAKMIKDSKQFSWDIVADYWNETLCA